MKHRKNDLIGPMSALALALLGSCGGGGGSPAAPAGGGAGGGGGGTAESAAPTRAIFQRTNAFGGSDLFAVGLGGDDTAIQLTQHTSEEVESVLDGAPQGTLVYSTSDGGDRRWSTVPVDGSGPARVLISTGEAASVETAHVIMDQYLVYARSGSIARIVAIDIATGTPTTLAEHGQGTLFFNSDYVTDSGHLIYSYQPEFFSGFANRTIYGVPLTGETSRVVLSTPDLDSTVYFDPSVGQPTLYGDYVVMYERSESGSAQLTSNNPTAPEIRSLIELPSTDYFLSAWTMVADHFVTMRRDPEGRNNLFSTALSGGPTRALSNITQPSRLLFSRDVLGDNGIAFLVERYSDGALRTASLFTVDVDDPATRTEVSNGLAFPFDPDQTFEFQSVDVVGDTLVIQRRSQPGSLSFARYGVAASEAELATLDLNYEHAEPLFPQSSAAGMFGKRAVVVDGRILLNVAASFDDDRALNLWSVVPGEEPRPLSDASTIAVGAVGRVHTVKSGLAVYSRGVLHYAVDPARTLSEKRITNNGFEISPLAFEEEDTDDLHATFLGQGQLLAARVDGSTDLVSLTRRFDPSAGEGSIERVSAITPDWIVFQAVTPNGGPSAVFSTPIDDDPTTNEINLSQPFDSSDVLIDVF